MNHTKRNTITCITRARLIFVLLSIFFLIIFTFNVFAQDYIEYKIKEGDCLWTIAQQFQLSIQDITEDNDIDQDQILSPGRSIKIPQNKIDDST
ncbi:MAG: LysM peptidoglycan-binding domain-containing protein, partial [Atribacterota bacterium]